MSPKDRWPQTSQKREPSVKKPEVHPTPKELRDAQTAERMLVVYDLLAQLWPHTRIRATLAKQWECSTDNVDYYIRKVYDAMADDSHDYGGHRRNRLRATFEAIFKRAMKEGKLDAATRAADKLARIDGVYRDRVELTGADGGPVTISAADNARAALAKRLAEIASKRGKS